MIRRVAAVFARESGVAEASAIFMAGFLVSAALGVVRQTLFNAQFGAGPAAAAYIAAFRLPDTLGSLIAGGALSSAIIPVLLGTERGGGEIARRRLLGLVLTTTTAATLVITILAIMAAPWFVRTVLAPGFDPPTAALATTLTQIMLLHTPISVFSSVAIAALNSRNRFALTALSIALVNIALIAGILLTMLYPPLGIYGPTIGVLLDAVLQAAILLPGARREGLRLTPLWDLRDAGLRAVVRLLIPNGLSVTVNYAGTIVDTAFASLARQPGSVPALHSALLLVGLPIRLAGQAVGQAAFPRFAAAAEAGDTPALLRALRWALLLSGGMALAAAAALTLLGRPLVRVLFERGQFDAAAADLTYAALAAYALGLPGYTTTEIIGRGLIALRDTRTPLLTNCVQLGGRVLLLSIFVHQYGAVVIPLVFALTSAVEALLLGGALAWRLRARTDRKPETERTIDEGIEYEGPVL